MSIYNTLWILRFPRFGDFHTGCEWVEVMGQGVAAYIGTPSPGYGYEAGDPYGSFLPSPVAVESADDEQQLRAIVVVTRGTPKGTDGSAQEYTQPLLVMSGAEYATVPFGDLVERISSALRGSRPRILLEIHRPDRDIEVVFDDDNPPIIRRPS